MTRTFLYRCPNTGRTVQDWSAEEVTDQEDRWRISVDRVLGVHTRPADQSENWESAR
jgi:hypothetical protein